MLVKLENPLLLFFKISLTVRHALILVTKPTSFCEVSMNFDQVQGKSKYSASMEQIKVALNRPNGAPLKVLKSPEF